MSGRILIIDSVATNRIVLKVKLGSANYMVDACATPDEARVLIETDRPDLVLLDLTCAPKAALDLCQTLRAQPATKTLPIVGMCSFGDRNARLGALRAGVDDTLEKPLPEALLLARIRSLLRADLAANELQLRDNTVAALGFAEAPSRFETAPARQAQPPQTTAGRVVIVASNLAAALPFGRDLSAILGASVDSLAPDRVMGWSRMSGTPDLFVIDGRLATTKDAVAKVFHLVSELRSGPETRHSAQLLLLPTNGDEVGAMALDLGANDVAPCSATTDEVGLRAQTLLQRKAQLDQLRASVQSELKAAVTDPLTGLYNRRYALPHLETLIQRARETERNLAVMAIDIDYFKRVNDSWGHAAGDKVLVGVAEKLRENLRAVDLIARIGGEEFLVVMPETTLQQAHEAAERLRSVVGQTAFKLDDLGQSAKITLSIGVSIGLPQDNKAIQNEPCDRIIERADAALYAAKSAGRNTVEVYPPRSRVTAAE